MAVFTDLTTAQIETCLAHYGFTVERVKGIAAGTQNTLYRVTTRSEALLLTVFEPPLANDPNLGWFIDLHLQLAKKYFPCPEPLRNIDGDRLSTYNGKLYCVFPFMEGEHATPTVEQAYAIGRVLAQLHQTQVIVPHMENSWGVETMRRAAHGTINKNWPEALAHAKTIVESVQTTHLPQGLIHGDLFPDNALFDENEVTAVIDFFFACHDAYAYDLAITISAWAFDSFNRHNPALEAAVMEGYTSLRPLTTEEQTAMPHLLQLACARFFLSRLKAFEAPAAQKMGAPHDPGVYAARLEHYQKQA